MPDRRGKCVGWLTNPLEKAELIFLKGIKANDLPSDDCCVICQEPYGTPNEDGSDPEYAVRFPCGHAVGNACFQTWFNGVDPMPGCIFCNKPLIPAVYLMEQVREIWIMVEQTTSERMRDELNNKTPRGSLTRSMESLQKYVNEAPSLEGPNSHEDLVPSFEALLMATNDFLAAVEKYAEDDHEMTFQALAWKETVFMTSYRRFQRVVEEMATAQMVREASVRSSLD